MYAARLSLTWGASVACAAALISACETKPSIPEIDFDARDFAFSLPDTMQGGLVRFRFTNGGQEDHHAQFIRLNEGVTRAQFDSVFGLVMNAARTEGEVAFMRLFAIATVAGGPSVVGAGGRLDIVMELAPGEYILLCFVPSPDGLPHLAKGMRRWLTVTDPPAEPPPPPVAKGRVDMADFAFGELPALDSGPLVLEVANSGQEPHEMVVLRLEGVSVKDLVPMLTGPPGEGAAPTGPPPFRFMGGVQAIMPGKRAWVTLNLPAGDYALICFIPSPANKGQSHAALGMVQSFRVG